MVEEERKVSIINELKKIKYSLRMNTKKMGAEIGVSYTALQNLLLGGVKFNPTEKILRIAEKWIAEKHLHEVVGAQRDIKDSYRYKSNNITVHIKHLNKNSRLLNAVLDNYSLVEDQNKILFKEIISDIIIKYNDIRYYRTIIRVFFNSDGRKGSMADYELEVINEDD